MTSLRFSLSQVQNQRGGKLSDWSSNVITRDAKAKFALQNKDSRFIPLKKNKKLKRRKLILQPSRRRTPQKSFNDTPMGGVFVFVYEKEKCCLPCAGNCFPPMGGPPSLILSAVWTSSSNCGFFCSSSRKTFYKKKEKEEIKRNIDYHEHQCECEQKI